MQNFLWLGPTGHSGKDDCSIHDRARTRLADKAHQLGANLASYPHPLGTAQFSFHNRTPSDAPFRKGPHQPGKGPGFRRRGSARG